MEKNIGAETSVKIALLGLGLIGGSIAKAIRQGDKSIYIMAYDHKDTLSKAVDENVINLALDSPAEACSADIIFFCLPAGLSIELFGQIAPLVKPGTILTDVCGVKGVFQNLWHTLISEGTYIGGHPMTGKEKGGYENSDPLLFENAVYILTGSVPENFRGENFLRIIRLLGSKIIFLDPFLHDKIVASVSHLPQLLSVGLTNAAAQEMEGVSFLDFAAGGFRDMTRIASSSYEVWEPVITYNRQEILNALNDFQHEIDTLKTALENSDNLVVKQQFMAANISRDVIPVNSKGFISKLFTLLVYVKDEPGIISKISTALFQESINIKDIELLKIREGEGGTFRLSFENESDLYRAKEILNQSGFRLS